jgi:two-component SAPR family response regulator
VAYSILLVDDEPNVLDGCRRQLNSFFDVQTAVNGYDGLKMLKNYGPFAVVLVDYIMPGMNGIDFTVNARQAAPETIRLMLTGKGDLQVASEALNRGSIFKFLAKPCPVDELLKAVILAVEKYRGCDYHDQNEPSEIIEGLKHLYRGMAQWSRGKNSAAIKDLLKASAIFSDSGDNNNLARVNLLIVGIAISADPSATEKEFDCNTEALVKQAVAIFKIHGFPALLRNEEELFIPALNWAYERNIEKAFLQAVLNELGTSRHDSDLLTIRSLGSMQVGSTGLWIEENDWRNPKVKMLFLYLLTNRHKKVDRDIIIEHFWPDMSPRAAGNNFSSTLYMLRQLTGSEKVAYAKGLCWLVKSEFCCDSDQFEETINLARQSLTEGLLNEAKQYFDQAVSIYRGDYLEEYIYEDWIIAERERLIAVFTKALSDYAELLAEEGRYLEAAEVLEKTPRSEVLDDQFIYKLVNYYILARSRSKAIRRYQHYRSVMIGELGIEPDSSIEKLLKQAAGPPA